mgnify:CR=1 FL=1
MRIGLLFFFNLLLIALFKVNAAEYELAAEETIVVTGTRIFRPLNRISRNLIILDSEQLSRLPVVSIPELLRYVASAGIQTRSPWGIQADLTLRGSTFELCLME